MTNRQYSSNACAPDALTPTHVPKMPLPLPSPSSSATSGSKDNPNLHLGTASPSHSKKPTCSESQEIMSPWEAGPESGHWLDSASSPGHMSQSPQPPQPQNGQQP